MESVKHKTKTAYILRTRGKCGDGDWRTQSAKGYSDIPPDTKVHPIRLWCNFYGRWLSVHWNGNRYDLRVSDVDIYEVTYEIHKSAMPGDLTHHPLYGESVVVGSIDFAHEPTGPQPGPCIIIKSKKDGLQLADPAECSYFRKVITEEKVGGGDHIREYEDELNIEVCLDRI